jgi:hypothetical protein
VTLDDRGRAGLLVGDFSRVDKAPAATSVWKGGERQQHSDVHRFSPETAARRDAKNEAKVLKVDTPNLKAETGRIEDHARDSSSRLSGGPVRRRQSQVRC